MYPSDSNVVLYLDSKDEYKVTPRFSLIENINNINNEALGMVRQWQDMNYGGRHSASTYADSLPDFVKLAESYGHVGMKVTKQSQLRKTLDKAFAMKDRLVFVDVYVDPNEHVYPMLVAPSGSMKDMWIKKNISEIDASTFRNGPCIVLCAHWLKNRRFNIPCFGVFVSI